MPNFDLCPFLVVAWKIYQYGTPFHKQNHGTPHWFPFDSPYLSRIPSTTWCVHFSWCDWNCGGLPCSKDWRNVSSGSILVGFLSWKKNKNNKNNANLRDLIAATGPAVLLKLDSNHRFFSPGDLEIWWPRKIIGHLFYITSSPLVN